MKEAIASFDAAGDALANDGASAAEGGDGGLAPRRVVRVDEGRRGAGLDCVAQFDERLEKPGVEGIDVIILAAHLHDSGLGRRRRRLGTSNVRMILVGDSADATDDWIAKHISAADVCVTSDIPLAARCLKKGARVVSPTGKHWTQANIGNALVGREIARHLRELGTNTRGPAPLTKRDRSRFLSELDTAVQAALREAARS
jgi:uncharacterized protein YaiI (UPF0178 family)